MKIFAVKILPALCVEIWFQGLEDQDQISRSSGFRQIILVSSLPAYYMFSTPETKFCFYGSYSLGPKVGDYIASSTIWSFMILVQFGLFYKKWYCFVFRNSPEVISSMLPL